MMTRSPPCSSSSQNLQNHKNTTTTTTTMTRKKRDKPYHHHHQTTPHTPSPFHPKRPRYHTPTPPAISSDPLDDNNPTATTTKPPVVVVTGLSNGCSVLKLKSRFEMYGAVSRLRIDLGVGYLTFRSKDSAEAAIAAASDPFLGITIDSQKVNVSWEDDPLPRWREGAGLSSKLLLPEIPLSKRGRGNKLRSSSVSPKNGLELSFKGRDIIAYDDLF